MRSLDVSEAEYLLAYLDLASLNDYGDGVSKKYQKLPVSYFNNADPLDLWGDIYDLEFKRRKSMLYFICASPDMCRAKVDASYLKHRNINQTETLINCNRIRAVTPKEMRGVAKLIYKYNFEVSSLWMDTRTMEAKTSRAIFGWLPKFDERKEVEKSKTILVTNEAIFDGNLVDIDYAIKTAIARTLTAEYYWRVSLGWEGKLRLQFPTDPLGIKELFKLKSIPNGSNRRKALLHWVTDHCRRKQDSDEKIDIDPYLRGAVTFNWNGLLCTIRPALDDVLRLKNTERQGLLLGEKE